MPYRIVFEELADETARVDGCALQEADLQTSHACVEKIQAAHNARCARGRRRLSPGVQGVNVIDTDTQEILCVPIPKA